MCANDNKNEIFIEHLQNNVRKSLVRQYIYARKIKKLTQEQVAQRAGIARTNVSRFESGEYNPTLEMMVKLANAMDMDLVINLEEK